MNVKTVTMITVFIVPVIYNPPFSPPPAYHFTILFSPLTSLTLTPLFVISPYLALFALSSFFSFFSFLLPF